MKSNLSSKLFDSIAPFFYNANRYLVARPELNRKLGLAFYTSKNTQLYLQHLSLMVNGNQIELEKRFSSLKREREMKITFFVLFFLVLSITYGFLKSDSFVLNIFYSLTYFTIMYCFFLHNAIQSYFILNKGLFEFKIKNFFNTYGLKSKTDVIPYKNEELNPKFKLNNDVEYIDFVTVEEKNILDGPKAIEIENQKLIPKIKGKQNYETSPKHFCNYEYYIFLCENDGDKIKFDGEAQVKIASDLFKKYELLVEGTEFTNSLKNNIKKPYNFLSFNTSGRNRNSQIANIEYTSHFFALKGKFKAKEKFDRDYNLSKKNIRNSKKKSI